MSFWAIVIGIIILVITYACSFFSFECEEGCGTFLALMGASLLVGLLALSCGDGGIFTKYIGIISLMNVGAPILAFLISWIAGEIFFECLEDIFGHVYAVIYFLCIVITFVVMNNQANNIVTIETPEVVTNRYELLASDEFTSGEDKYSKLMYSPGSGYYEFFYQTKDGNGVAVIETYTVDVDDVKVTIQPVMEEADYDYLLEVVTTYYEEDRNKEPYEKRVISKDVERILYLRKSTFENMIIVGNSE